MANATFQCRLITPTAKVLDGPIEHASVPAWDGLFGVLANRAPIVAKLGMGELRLDSATGSRSFLVEDGFAQMVNNKLTIIAAKAIPTEKITQSEAQAELREAEARTVPADHPQRTLEVERLTKDRSRARMKLKLAGGGKGE